MSDLPDFEADVDLGTASGVPPFLGGMGNWQEVAPGDDDWDTPPVSAAATPEAPVYEDSFPPEIEQPLRGLMFLGHLEKRFDLYGHSFVMRTLKAGEELACTLVIKEFEETLGQAKALAMAFVAASVVSVDRRKMTQALGPDDTLSALRQRFEYVQGWFWPVIESLYTEYSDLSIIQAQVYEALSGK